MNPAPRRQNSARTPVPNPWHAAEPDDEAFGLIGWLEKTRVRLPLKGIDCQFAAAGGQASVKLDQVYLQANAAPLDVRYTFPLPDGAAAHLCEVFINERIIRARVMPEAEAREAATREKARGRRTMLVESVRPNLFEMELGNIQPGDLVVVRFAWFQTLEMAGDRFQLRLPFCPGVRYIPGKPLLRANRGRGAADDTDQVPDASRLSPPRISDLHPDAAAVCVEGRLDAGDIEEASVSSPTHAIAVVRAEETLHVVLAGGRDFPDRDFVVSWNETPVADAAPRVWIARGENRAHALVRVRAPREMPKRARAPLHAWFLIDRSGSMAGEKWTQTVKALHGFVELLDDADMVWITCFESEFQDFSDAPMAAGEMRRDTGFLGLESVGTTGGTELLPALVHVLKKIAAARRARRPSAPDRDCVILVTDGQVGNEAAVLSRMAPHRDIPVHCFGIDTAVNDAFLRALARQQRASCTLLAPDDDIAGTVRALGGRLQAPVLTALELPREWKPAAGGLPDLHAGEAVWITAEGPAHARLAELRARDGAGRAVALPCAEKSAMDEAPRLLWARDRIEQLLQAGRQADAVAVAVEHGIACPGASFVAWDEAEKVAIAQREVYQPSPELADAMPFLTAAKPMVTEISFSLCSPPPPKPTPAPVSRCAESGLFPASEGGALADDPEVAAYFGPAGTEVMRLLAKYRAPHGSVTLRLEARIKAVQDRLRNLNLGHPETMALSLAIAWALHDRARACARLDWLERLVARLEAGRESGARPDLASLLRAEQGSEPFASEMAAMLNLVGTIPSDRIWDLRDFCGVRAAW